MIVNSVYYQSEKKIIDPKQSIVINSESKKINDIDLKDPNNVYIFKAYQRGLLENFIIKNKNSEFLKPYRPVTYQDFTTMIDNLKRQGIQIYDKPFWSSNTIISREQMAKNIVTLFAFDLTEFKGYKTPIVFTTPKTTQQERMFGAAPVSRSGNKTPSVFSS